MAARMRRRGEGAGWSGKAATPRLIHPPPAADTVPEESTHKIHPTWPDWEQLLGWCRSGGTHGMCIMGERSPCPFCGQTGKPAGSAAEGRRRWVGRSTSGPFVCVWGGGLMAALAVRQGRGSHLWGQGSAERRIPVCKGASGRGASTLARGAMAHVINATNRITRMGQWAMDLNGGVGTCTYGRAVRASSRKGVVCG